MDRPRLAHHRYRQRFRLERNQIAFQYKQPIELQYIRWWHRLCRSGYKEHEHVLQLSKGIVYAENKKKLKKENRFFIFSHIFVSSHPKSPENPTPYATTMIIGASSTETTCMKTSGSSTDQDSGTHSPNSEGINPHCGGPNGPAGKHNYHQYPPGE